MDGRMDGCMEIHPYVLQDIGSLGPLPKKLLEALRSPKKPFISPKKPIRSPKKPFRSPKKPFRSPQMPFTL